MGWFGEFVMLFLREIPSAVLENFWPQSRGDLSSRVGFTVISEWGYSHQRSGEIGRALSGKNPSSRVETLSGRHSHCGEF